MAVVVFLKSRFFVLTVLWGMLAGLIIVQWRRTSTENKNVVAVGLRATTRVTRPLSTLQQKRLKKYFTETQSVPVSHQQRSGGTNAEVNTLNRFNHWQDQK